MVTDKLSAYVVKVTDEPDVVSVPASKVVRYCELEILPLEVRYFKKAFTSPLKLVTVPLVGRNEYT
jgi:hypothetical protein